MSRRVSRFSAPALAALVVAAAACARPGAPSGGPEDRRPPVVASVEPEPFSLIEPGSRTLRLRFNERISERPLRGTLEDVVTVSPRTGEVSVSHDREGLDIEIGGGFRAGLVYRVTVAPELNDMFGNPMAVPFEWVFSTGDSIRPNAIVGQVWDATTGDPVTGAAVHLRRVPGGAGDPPADTFPYVARTDSVGIFALRYLPAGPVEVVAWEDLDGDREVDFTEAVRRQRLQLGASDTVTLTNLPVLAADTARAVLEDAEVLDSLTIRLEFDDFLDPAVPIGEVAVELVPAVDSTGAVLEAAQGASAPAVARVFHEVEFAEWADSLAEALESAAVAADTLPPDTVPPDAVAADTMPPDTLPPGREAEDTAGAAPPARPATPQDFALDQALDLLPDGNPVPQTSLVVRLAEPLPVGVPFDIVVSRVINLAQLAGGGGRVTVEREPPEPEEPPPGSPPPAVRSPAAPSPAG